MKISIIIPTWNRADKIEKTIRSVQNQTFQNWEILICDDGSTDNTKEIIETFAREDSRIKWIPGTHAGLPATPRNRGIKQAQGEWLAFLDSDDEWLPEKLEKQIKQLEEKKLKAACTNAYRFIPAKNEKLIYSSYQNEQINFSNLIKSNLVVTSSAIIHRSLIEETFGFPEDQEQKGIEDYSFWLRIATFTNFGYLSEPLLIYTDDAANSVRGLNTKNAFTQKKIILKNYLLWIKKRKNNLKNFNIALIALININLQVILFIPKSFIKKLIKK